MRNYAPQARFRKGPRKSALHDAARPFAILPELLTGLRTNIDKLCEMLLSEPGGFIPQLSAAIGKFQAQPGVWADHSTRVVRQGEARIGSAIASVQRQLAVLRVGRLDLAVELQDALAPLLRFSEDHRNAMRTALLVADERAPAQVERNRNMTETLSALGMRPQTAGPEFRRGVEERVAAAPADPVTAKAKLAPVLSHLKQALGRLARVHPEVAAAFDLPRGQPKRVAPAKSKQAARKIVRRKTNSIKSKPVKTFARAKALKKGKSAPAKARRVKTPKAKR